MPRAQNSPIRMYFLIQANENNGHTVSESECKVCGLRMKGNHASNMERHVRRSHPIIYEKYLEIKQQTFNPETKSHNEELTEKLCEEFNLSNDFDKIKKKKPNEKQSHPTTNGSLKKEDIIDACVELVTFNGRPFSLMNDSGFKTLVDALISKTCPSLVIDEDSIKNHVFDKAKNIKSSIIHNLRNQMISLKLDCVTHCNRSFLGIHAQRVIDGEVKLFTLSLVEINVRMDSTDLNELIWNELSKFEINKSQIYCATIDSGSELVKLLEENTTRDTLPSKPCSSTSDNNVVESTSYSNEEALDSVQVITIYSEFEDEGNDLDSKTTEIILEKLHLQSDETYAAVDGDFGIVEMKCMANELQSAIINTFKLCPEIFDLIKEAHQAIKKLHSPSISMALRKANYNLPQLDLSLKWKSVYCILEKLVNLKLICLKLHIFDEKTSFWERAAETLDALKHYKSVAEALQTEQFTLCDVYKLWFNCILEISKLDTPIARILSSQMRMKQETLFENVSFLGAVFLDPRFNNMVLNETHKENAISHLLTLYKRTTTHASQTIKIEDTFHAIDQAYDGENGEEDELEKVFREQEHCIKLQKSDVKCRNMELALRNFCENEPRLRTNENILHFWERKKSQYPEIYNLVCILLSVPATQRSLTCLIDQVKYIIDSGKMKISYPLFNNVLLIRGNAEL